METYKRDSSVLKSDLRGFVLNLLPVDKERMSDKRLLEII